MVQSAITGVAANRSSGFGFRATTGCGWPTDELLPGLWFIPVDPVGLDQDFGVLVAVHDRSFAVRVECPAPILVGRDVTVWECKHANSFLYQRSVSDALRLLLAGLTTGNLAAAQAA